MASAYVHIQHTHTYTHRYGDYISIHTHTNTLIHTHTYTHRYGDDLIIHTHTNTHIQTHTNTHRYGDDISKRREQRNEDVKELLKHTYTYKHIHTHTNAHRYGDDISKRREQRNEDVKELLNMDQMKRQLAMMAEVRNIKNILIGKDPDAPVETPEEEFFSLSLTIKEARDLPKMDVLHGIDSYCVVSVDNMEDEVYQTKVCVYV